MVAGDKIGPKNPQIDAKILNTMGNGREPTDGVITVDWSNMN